jgi:hypothetical protein
MSLSSNLRINESIEYETIVIVEQNTVIRHAVSM